MCLREVSDICIEKWSQGDISINLLWLAEMTGKKMKKMCLNCLLSYTHPQMVHDSIPNITGIKYLLYF